jgi:hypothetical protein
MKTVCAYFAWVSRDFTQWAVGREKISRSAAGVALLAVTSWKKSVPRHFTGARRLYIAKNNLHDFVA